MPGVSPSFDQRLRRLTATHRRLAAGVRPRMRPDGLLVAYPRRRLPNVPWRGIAILFMTALAFKGVMLSVLGVSEYQRRVDALSLGTATGPAAAFVMQIDPVTDGIATALDRLVRRF